jgi:hypothetical protein
MNIKVWKAIGVLVAFGILGYFIGNWAAKTFKSDGGDPSEQIIEKEIRIEGDDVDHSEMEHDDSEVHRIVEGLEASGFQGDTTVAIEHGSVKVHREGDKVEVDVEVKKTLRRDAPPVTPKD